MADKIGQILLDRGIITTEQLKEALRTQEFFGGQLGSHLINLGHVRESDLSELLSEIYGVPAAPTEELKGVSAAAALLPPALAVKYTAVPFRAEGREIWIAIANPRDAVALREMAQATNRTVVVHVAPEFRILSAIEKSYVVKSASSRKKIALSPAEPPPRRPSGSTQAPAAPAPPGRAISLSSVDPRLESKSGAPGASPAARGPASPHRENAASPVPVAVPAPVPDTGPNPLEPMPAPFPPSAPHEPVEEFGLPDTEPYYRHDGAEGDADVLPESWETGQSEGGGADPGEASAGPGTLEELVATIEGARDRDALCRSVVLFMARHFARAAVLAALPDRIRLLDAAGSGIDPATVRARPTLPAGEPSLFESLRNSSRFHLGPLGYVQPGTRAFFAILGDVTPPSAFVIPVPIRDRTVAFLYADNGRHETGHIDPDTWRRVAALTGAALEIQLLRKKLKSL